MKNELLQPDRVTWSQSVRINIADYEHRDIHISYSTAVRDGELPEKAVARARKKVQSILHKQERKIRLQSKDDVDFDTMSRVEV